MHALAFTILLLFSTLLFVTAGVIIGGQYSKTEYVFSQSSLQIAVGVVVTIVWVSTIAVEILITEYTVSVLIHGIMGAVVGYLFSDKNLNITIGG